MRRVLRGRGGAYELCWWHERRDDPRALPLRDAGVAAAFARELVHPPGGVVGVRAFLAARLPWVHRLDDEEVVEALASRFVSGQVIAARLPGPTLQAADKGAVEAPERAPQAGPPREQKTWIEIELVDMEGQPVPNERYWIELPDGGVREGRLDAHGRAYFGELDPGDCEIRWPDLDDEALVGGKRRPVKPAAPAAKKTWVEVELCDMEGRPIAGAAYRLKLPDGSVREGSLDASGRARADGIDPGTCEVTFPDHDRESCEPVA